MGPNLHIRLLGDFALLRDGRHVGGFDAPRLQALMASLVLQRNAPQTRRRIAYAFWPESNDRQALTNLRQLLFHLRRAFPQADDLLDVGSAAVGWRLDAPCTVDLVSFEQALDDAKSLLAANDHESAIPLLEQAADLYTGDILPACYDAWIEPERERVRRLAVEGLDVLTNLLEMRREYAEAVRRGEQLLRLDPLRESTCRILMQLHALCGHRARALQVYEECRGRLENELGIKPAQATREQFERLQAARPPEEHSATGKAHDRLPLVGRHADWSRLLASWREAERGAQASGSHHRRSRNR